MYKSISIFLAGVLTAILVYLKLKDPSVVNIAGDQVNDLKIKDNRKIKTKRKGLFRKIFKTKEERRLNKLKRNSK